MSLFVDRVYETTTTTGTGAITMAGAVLGYFTFAAKVANPSTVDYVIVDNTTGDVEIGRGTWTTTLARDTVLSSSNGGAAVNFAAGTKQVFLTAASHSIGNLLENNTWTATQTLSVAPIFTVTQASHGFVPGNAIVKNATVWAKSSASVDTTLCDAVVTSVSGNDFTYVVTGPITLTTAQWDTVTGLTGGLPTGEYLFTSETSGKLTTTAPAISQVVLKALSTTSALLMVGGVFDSDGMLTITAAGLALMDDADASAQRTTLGLGTAAVVNTGTSGATIPLLNGANTWAGLNKYSTNIVVAKTTNIGIQVDEAAPTFGWRDILGQLELRGVGANDPTFAVYGATNQRAYSFSATVMQEVFIVFHIPHDYVPGTDIFFHMHWSNAAATPNTGNVIWGFEYQWAKGYNQAAFSTAATITVTQASPATRYMHQIAETAAITLSGLEVDSLILVRAYRDAAAGGDTCTDAVFGHTADIHYQSTNLATKAKNGPGFYT